jgi:hypothetical protein
MGGFDHTHSTAGGCYWARMGGFDRTDRTHGQRSRGGGASGQAWAAHNSNMAWSMLTWLLIRTDSAGHGGCTQGVGVGGVADGQGRVTHESIETRPAGCRTTDG